MTESTVSLPGSLPLIVIENDVLLPLSTIRIPITSRQNMAVVKRAYASRTKNAITYLGVIIKKPQASDVKDTKLDISSLNPIGTAATVVQIAGTSWPEPAYSLLVSGVCRFRLEKLDQITPFLEGTVQQLDKLQKPEIVEQPELAELVSTTKSKITTLIELLDLSLLSTSRIKRLLSSVPVHNIPDLVVTVVNASFADKLDVLNAVDLVERFRKTQMLLQQQIEALPTTRRPRRIIPLDPPSYRPSVFRKLPVLDANGEGDMDTDDLAELESKLRAAKLPEHAQKVATRELRRLKKMMPQLPDYNVTRTYLELMSELPWSKSSQQTLNIHKARADLDADHYAMEKVKKRVLEYLAVRQLRNSLRGPILCFVGPPGVGKTSIGRSIASTIGREFHRISLGGVCDQSDIRGHRRTYIGAFPGRIVQGLRTVGVNNPVFLLDEIDKLTAGLHGDPSAALLEVLDPEQNNSYTDHYLNIPFDLSQVLFIATANSVRNIPPALLDRMEIIPVSGYTQEEKLHIAIKHLIPKQLLEHGLDDKTLQIPEESVKHMIARYTREAGVRSLERKIGALCRAVAVVVAEGARPEAVEGARPEAVEGTTPETNGSIPAQEEGGVVQVVGHPNSVVIPVVLDESAVEDILGLPPFDNEVSGHSDQPGVAVGLAWTPVGGDIMYVEATKVEGDGRLVLTGQLGSVMRESAKLALNWVRTHADDYGIVAGKGGVDLMEHMDIHIHFPAGAQGKDGPSAGVTIICVLVSLFTGRCVSPSVAMTGEVTLRGLVLPVGGIKDKVLAAHRAGITKVIMPFRNQKDLNDVPVTVQKDMTFIFVKYIDDVLQAAFDGGFPESRLNVDNIVPSNL